METASEKATAAIAVLITIGVIGMSALRVEVPQQLWTGFGVVLGFFFGQVTTARMLRIK